MRRKRSKTHPASSQPRIDRLLESQEKDPYGMHGSRDPMPSRHQ